MEPQPVRQSRFVSLNAFIDRGQAHLRKLNCGSAAALWLTLWRFENAKSGLTRVSAAKLAARYGTDTSTVRRMIAQLEECGYLETVESGKPGRGSCAVYRLVADPKIGVTVTPIHPEEKGGTMPPITDPRKGGMVPPITKVDVAEKGAPCPLFRGANRGHGAPCTEEEQKKDIAASAATATKADPKPKKTRARNPLFDVLIEVTGVDPVVNGGHVGKVAALLSKANPPYTPNEVRSFASRWRELHPWAKPAEHPRLTLGILQKYVSTIRTAGASPAAEVPRVKTANEILATQNHDFAPMGV